MICRLGESCGKMSNYPGGKGLRVALCYCCLDPSCGFSTKSTFFSLTNGALKNLFPMVAPIWKLKIPKKGKVFL